MNNDLNAKAYTVKRKTSESEVVVTLTFGQIEKDYRKKIQTPLPFLNHMIEHIAWRAGINIEVFVSLSEFALNHLICEDVGITLGKCIYEYINDNVKNGVIGYGDGVGIIDEAMARTAISFEDRAYFDFRYDSVNLPNQVEGINSEDLVTFLEGFVQGAKCSLHVDVIKGVNGHHIWEAVYRAFGICLNRSTAIDIKRKDMTSGVAGKNEFDIKKE